MLVDDYVNLLESDEVVDLIIPSQSWTQERGMRNGEERSV